MIRLLTKLAIAALVALPLAAQAAPQGAAAGGGPQGGKDPQAPAGPLAQPQQWGALLVSGDASIPAFDNMVNGLARRLVGPSFPRGSVIAVTARTQSPYGSSTIAGIAQAASQMRLGPNQGCLVFVTAHGSPQGVAITQRNETLSPGQLDRIVDSACGQRATVVIVSACFSGVFIEPLARPNRVVLTAARRDRTSFGCSADNVLTVFDGCILQAVRSGAPWRQVAATARSCVTTEEQRLRVLASEPQLFVGPSVQALVAP
jgi:hypothetical protein